ncbi:MAG: SDR family oxidoreductase [Fimbriimonadales bacterium]|nr:SDR family oxidoreductase [Fimbriimonadales bacterium]
MRALFIGGTGIISSACSEWLVERGHEVIHLNRGTSRPAPPGVRTVVCDVRAGGALPSELQGERFDAVADFIAFTAEDIERDLAWFRGRTRQFVFISSASVYQKPPSDWLIREDTPLANPYWEYSRNKIACEQRLQRAFREEAFPATIVRPSLTYSDWLIPLCINSWSRPWTIIDRMRRGKPVIVPGDGTSLWTVTHNTDFARGFGPLLGNEAAVGHAFHITSDEALTWNQLYRQAAHAAGVEAKLVPMPSDLIAALDGKELGSLLGDKSHSTVFDLSKLRRFVPDYRPRVPWREGVARCIRWFEADPSRQLVDSEADARWDAMIAQYSKAWPAGVLPGI